MRDFDAAQAFDNVLDRLVTAEANAGAMRDQRDKAQAAQREAEIEARHQQGLVSTYRARQNQDDAIHEVLKDVKTHFEVNPLEASPVNITLLARLKKAVEDTDPIPF